MDNLIWKFDKRIILLTDVTEVYDALLKFQQLNREVKDILECRIEAVLEEIGSSLLCWLPEDDAATPEEFQEETEKVCAQASQKLSK